MPSNNYRYLCYDAAGNLHGPTAFSAASDEDAIAKIEAKHPHDLCEIWQERRLVATIDQTSSRGAIESSMRSLAKAHRTLRETAALVSGSSSAASA